MTSPLEALNRGPVKEWLRSPVPRYWLLCIIAVGSLAAYLYPRIPMPGMPLPRIDTAGSLGIASLLSKVRQELTESEARRVHNKEPPMFHVTEFDMEVNFVVRREGGVNGEINVQVITAGLEHSFASETVHKLRLHMVVPKNDHVYTVPASEPPKQAGEPSSDVQRKHLR